MASNLMMHRNIASLFLLALLAACGSNPSRISPNVEAHRYQEDAKRNYTPPGTAADPWGPYIIEASNRFDVPVRWIRQVIQMESGGNEYLNGQLITSSAGAMGLMQLEPETYDELRAQYALGDDPYDPHDNILAGTAYLRQLYNQFGTPGFLAAYNAGPGRFSNYLAGRTDLPNETRHYVAVLAPAIEQEQPLNRSPNDQYAYNSQPVAIPSERRGYGGTEELADNQPYDPPQGRSVVGRVTTSALATPVPPTPPPAEVARYAPPHRAGSLGFISSAYADTLPEQATAGGSFNWEIQVGAYANRQIARAATVAAKQEEPTSLGRSATVIGSVIHDNHTMYRARLAGLTRNQAEEACERLGRIHTNCIVVSPDSTT